MVAFGLLDPQQVVIEQFVGGVRGKALVGQAGRAHQHPPPAFRSPSTPRPGLLFLTSSALPYPEIAFSA